jgi:hypothetical protein
MAKSKFNGWTDIDRAKRACDEHVKQQFMIDRVDGVNACHIVEANLMPRDDWRDLPDGNYLLATDLYWDQVKKFWEINEPNKVIEPIYTAKIVRQ